MAINKLRPARGNGTGLGECFATTPSSSIHSANPCARQARTPALSILSIDTTALVAVLAAPDLATAHAAARSGLYRLAAEAPCDLLGVDEAAQIAGRTPSTVRRWAAAHRLGRRLGGRWLLSRARFRAFVEGAVA